MPRRSTIAAGVEVTAGAPSPLGAAWNGHGVNFAVYSAHAERVELCLYDATGSVERARIALPGRAGDIWHGFVPAPAAGPGTLYGFRADGPYDPARGHLFNPAKLLLDPCARDVVGEVRYHPALRASDPADGDRQAQDSAACVPRSRVVDGEFDWGGIAAPGTPWRDTVIYELHVRGFTRRHPAVPPEWRGKYLGLTVPAVIDHIRSLGVTAVELMPCHAFVSEEFLVERGLSNYWGYNPLAFFAPERRYAVEDPVREFRQMVRALHEAGLEVILDVVLNHTAEGGEGGPVLSLKGLDNASYYRLDPNDPRRYDNLTGTGNALRAEHPAVRKIVLDCLRYWADEMRVDGFRFDLAPVLGRGAAGFTPQAPLFAAIRSDPVLAYMKFIAEPWDLGPGGYQLGRFPAGWSEWNDRFRDTVRAFWRGDAALVPSLAERFAGSSDLFRQGGRKPSASINFVTAHDGFTLNDLVSYSERHNEANLENNHDGHRHNLSWNCGVEGPSDDPAVQSLRRRQMRNLLATIALSQGVPMLLAGDEFARTQRGNNNAYCQDNELSWLDWQVGEAGRDLARFVARAFELRRRRPELRRETFLKGTPSAGPTRDVRWLHPAGRDMTAGDWYDPALRELGVWLGRAPDAPPGCGDLLILLTASAHEIEFALPEGRPEDWRVVLDTTGETGEFAPEHRGNPLVLTPRSLRVLEGTEAGDAGGVQDT